MEESLTCSWQISQVFDEIKHGLTRHKHDIYSYSALRCLSITFELLKFYLGPRELLGENLLNICARI